MARGEVQSGQMRGEQRDVAAVNFAQQVLMVFSGILIASSTTLLFGKPGFAVVSADKKAARTTCGINGNVAGTPDAKSIDDVDDVFVGIKLSELLSFFRRNQLLKNSADDVVWNFAKVVLGKIGEQSRPTLAGHIRGKDQRARPIINLRIKNGFIIPCFSNSTFELVTKVIVDAALFIASAPGHFQLVEIIRILRPDCFVKNRAIRKDVAKSSGRALQSFTPVIRIAWIKRPIHLLRHPRL